MPTPYAYWVSFCGPPENQSAVIDALTKANLAAEACEPGNDTETDLGWVKVLAHEGHDRFASLEFQERINAQAAEAAAPFGYSRRNCGNVIAAF